MGGRNGPNAHDDRGPGGYRLLRLRYLDLPFLLRPEPQFQPMSMDRSVLKKLLSAFLVLCLSSSQANAWTLKASTFAQSLNQNDVTTSGIDTTGADLIIIVAGWYPQGGTVKVKDSASNTWSSKTSYFDGLFRQIQISYVFSPTTGVAQTFGSGGTGDTCTQCYAAITVEAWSGSTSNGNEGDKSANTGSGTSLQPGSISPAANDLFITGIAAANSATGFTNGGVFTVSNQHAFTGNGVAIGMAHGTSSSAQNPTWSWTNADEAIAAMTAFKPSGGATTYSAPFFGGN